MLASTMRHAGLPPWAVILPLGVARPLGDQTKLPIITPVVAMAASLITSPPDLQQGEIRAAAVALLLLEEPSYPRRIGRPPQIGPWPLD